MPKRDPAKLCPRCRRRFAQRAGVPCGDCRSLGRAVNPARVRPAATRLGETLRLGRVEAYAADVAAGRPIRYLP